MRRPLLALLLLAVPPGVSAPAAGLEVGAESVVAAPSPGADLRGTPHLAFGGDGYLAVWREGFSGEGGEPRIAAVRLDLQGKPLGKRTLIAFGPPSSPSAPRKDAPKSPSAPRKDAPKSSFAPRKDASPFPPPQDNAFFAERKATSVRELPRVAFGAGRFLVVWQEFDGDDYDVLAARMSAEGKLLDSEPLVVAGGPGAQAVPDVASDGANFLVAWQGVRRDDNQYRIGAAVVSAEGRVGAPVEFGSPWTKAGACPRLAWDGRRYRAAFVAQTLLAVRLAADGALVAEPPAVLRSNLGAAIGFSHAVAAAPDGRMLAVFSRAQPDYWGWGGPGAAICSLVGPENKVDPSIPKEDYPQARLANWLDFARDKGEGQPWPHGPAAAAWDGRRFVAVWQRQHIAKTVSLHNGDLLAARVDGWRPLDPAGAAVAATEFEERHPALAGDGRGGALCVYERHDAQGRVTLLARPLR